ncbi:MAG: hypothetical protein R6V57_08630 [Vicinamibacterales bacterium]
MPNADRTPAPRPAGVAFLAIVNWAAFVVTLAFWALVYVGRLVPPPGSLPSEVERANAAVTYGFMLGDVIYSVPLLLLAGAGLWRLRAWGWLAAQMANALWIYSMTVILLRDFYSRWSPGGLLFAPFAIIALWAVPYLWRVRRGFGIVD